MTRHLFIINPVAGRKDRTSQIKRSVESLLLTDPTDFAVTDGVGAAMRIAESYINDHPEDFVRVYSCGGDGTLCEIAEGVWRTGRENAAIGVVPTGSGNDFVKYFHVPADRFRNLRALTRGECSPIDVMRVRDADGRERISINIVSAGFDAAVAKGMDKYKKLPLVGGSAAYNLSLAECLVSKMKNRFTLFVDDELSGGENAPYLFAIAANGSYYGGGYNAAPYSDLSDGLIDFIRIDTVSRLKFLRLVGGFRAGKHIRDFGDVVSFTRCRKLQIVSESLIDVNLDGEIVRMKNPVIEILPKNLKIILPGEDIDA